MASCLAALDEPDEALIYHEEAMEVHERLLPADHPERLRTQIGLAHTLVTLGRLERAERLLADAADHCARSEPARRWHGETVRAELRRLDELSKR